MRKVAHIVKNGKRKNKLCMTWYIRNNILGGCPLAVECKLRERADAMVRTPRESSRRKQSHKSRQLGRAFPEYTASVVFFYIVCGSRLWDKFYCGRSRNKVVPDSSSGKYIGKKKLTLLNRYETIQIPTISHNTLYGVVWRAVYCYNLTKMMTFQHLRCA